MTTARKTLIDDAVAAGYTLSESPCGTMTLIKFTGRWKRPVGLVMYPDGVAVRLEVDPNVATGITDFKTMREILGIEEVRVAMSRDRRSPRVPVA